MATCKPRLDHVLKNSGGFGVHHPMVAEPHEGEVARVVRIQFRIKILEIDLWKFSII